MKSALFGSYFRESAVGASGYMRDEAFPFGACSVKATRGVRI